MKLRFVPTILPISPHLRTCLRTHAYQLVLHSSANHKIIIIHDCVLPVSLRASFASMPPCSSITTNSEGQRLRLQPTPCSCRMVGGCPTACTVTLAESAQATHDPIILPACESARNLPKCLQCVTLYKEAAKHTIKNEVQLCVP